MKERKKYIDVAKEGIGIILVVLGHCLAYGCQNRVFAAIYAFHMPLFFFLSGYVYKPKEVNTFFSAKLKSLLLPVIFFEGLNLIIFFLLKVACKVSHHNIDDYFGYLTFGGSWFPMTLLYISSFYYLFDCKITQKFKNPVLLKMLSAFFFLVIGLVYARKISDKPNELIATAMVGYYFYVCGNIFSVKSCLIIQKITEKTIYRFFFLLFCVLLFTVLFYLVGFSDHNVDMYSSRYNNRLLFVINALLGTFAIIMLSLVIKQSKILEWYGKNSLLILFVHHPLWRSFDFLIRHTKKIPEGWCKSIVVFIISLTLLTLIVIIINRSFIFLTGKINFQKTNNEVIYDNRF